MFPLALIHVWFIQFNSRGLLRKISVFCPFPVADGSAILTVTTEFYTVLYNRVLEPVLAHQSPNTLAVLLTTSEPKSPYIAVWTTAHPMSNILTVIAEYVSAVISLQHDRKTLTPSRVLIV